MRTHLVRIQIASSPSVIWSVLTEFETWPEWTASVKSAQRMDSSLPTVGSQVRIEQPKLPPAVWTITRWVPEQCFTWISKSPGVVVTADHLIESNAEGSLVTLRIHFGGVMGWLVGLLAGGLTRKYMNMEASGLKARAEARRPS